MSPRGGLAGSAAAMFSGTLVSRVLGVVRNALAVAAIGVTGSGAANAFSVANKLPNIIYMLLAGGILNAVLVPQIVRAMRREDGGREYVNRLLTLAGLAMLVVTVLLTAGAGVLVTLYAADFRSGPWSTLAVAFAIWCIPQLFFYGMYTLLGQVLNARSNFGPYMWAPAVNNVVSILGVVAYLVVYGSFETTSVGPEEWDAGRVALLAGPWTLGVAVQAAVLVIPLYRSGFRYKPVWGLRNTGLEAAGRVATWAFAALAAGQVGYLAVSNLAAAAGTTAATAVDPAVDPAAVAGNAAYDNAFLIFMLPQSLITVSLVTALFTRLSGQAAAGQAHHVRDGLSFGLRILSVFTVFAGGAFMVLAIPLTQLVLMDATTFTSTRAVAHVLVAMLVGLPSIAIWTMVQRVYFAYEDTRSLFRIQVPMALILIVGSVASYLLLDVQWWVVGAGVATSVSNTAGALVAYLALRRKLPNLDGPRVLRTHLRVFLAAVPAALVGWGLLHLWGVQTNWLGALVRVLAVGLVMGLVYVVLLRRLRVSELDGLLDRVGTMLAPLTRRLTPVTGRLRVPTALRTMWRSLTGQDRNGGARVTQGAVSSLTVGTVLADRYLLREKLPATLAHSTRWLAHDEILQREVHVLVLDGPHREEALDAARRSALVADPRLVKILRVGAADGFGFIVTDLLVGPTLADLVANGPLPPAQARALVGEAATAVEAARKRGVHHLRLRPSALRRVDGEVVLTGMAVDAAHTGADALDARSAGRRDSVDLVALLYTALTGTWPGDPALASGVPLAPRHGDAPAPPGDVVDGVPHDLDTLCAVTFGPHDDGPYTPGELVRDLAPWDDVDPTAVGGPPSAGDAAQEPDQAVAPPPVPAAPHAGPAVSQTIADLPAAGGPDETTLLTPVPQAPDPSAWRPQPPPGAAEPRSFESVMGAAGTDDAEQDAHHARHEPGHGTAPSGVSRLISRGSAWVSGLAGSIAGAGAARAADGAGSAAAGAGSPAVSGTAVSGTAASGAAASGAAASGAAASGAAGAGWDLPDEDTPEDLEDRALEPVIGAGPLPSTRPVQAGWDVSSEEAAADAAASQQPDSAVHAVAGSVAAAVGAAAGTVVGGGKRLADAVGGAAQSFNEKYRRDPDADPVHRPAPQYEGADTDRSRFNPTPIVITVMAALVVIAVLLALNSLREAATSYVPRGDDTPVATTTEPAPEETTTPAPEPTEAPPVTAVFTGAQSLDPAAGVGDNEDTAGRAIDGNPDTTWNSLRYNNPQYGIKEGLGFAVTFEEPVLVTTVTLDVHGTGGVVQIRNTDPSAPNAGEVLAEGPMGPATTYTLSTPTELSSLVLWFPELPVASSDGRNRIELAEISVA